MDIRELSAIERTLVWIEELLPMTRRLGGLYGKNSQLAADVTRKADRHVRAVDEYGAVKKLADGSGDQVVTDVFLRDEYPPPGKGRAKRMGDTATEQMHNSLVDFGEAMDRVEETFNAIWTVLGDDGPPGRSQWCRPQVVQGLARPHHQGRRRLDRLGSNLPQASRHHAGATGDRRSRRSGGRRSDRRSRRRLRCLLRRLGQRQEK